MAELVGGRLAWHGLPHRDAAVVVGNDDSSVGG